MLFKKILIANRGEIALRVMRSAKEMGIATVAIYSEADRNALHVQYADEAYCVGPALSKQSYLCGDKIVAIAIQNGVDAIHPGYGFLSENEDFASAVQAAGITFVGPPIKSIALMGSKLAAKQFAKENNIPLVPGTEEAITDVAEAMRIAATIGYPILIKASAGGGGKGMRVVYKADEFIESMHLAVSEANAAFGDGSVFIEKYVTSPRHIEIQVLADKYGNVVHLFERECSIQRRHQKVIEEAPSCVLTPELRHEMGSCAVKIAQKCNYEGVGTVEFLLDENNNFYFLEMNTRLQVEHPVTEMITGKDLVKEQIKAAAGIALSFTQEELYIYGHSIEVRVYAENPLNNFLPDIGTLQTYEIPQGNGVRVDDAFSVGMEIPIYYDPMIAKLIVHAENREAAIQKMTRAIQDYKIVGVETTLSFCEWAINHEAFRTGDFDTNFITAYFTPEILTKTLTKEEQEIAAILAALVYKDAQPTPLTSNTAAIANLPSAWKLQRR